MRRVELGTKLCLRTLASAVSDKFSFLFGQYLLAGKKCFQFNLIILIFCHFNFKLLPFWFLQFYVFIFISSF